MTGCGGPGSALLLVTGSYLASRFIMEEELPALVAHGVRLVPVLVKDCLWDQRAAAGRGAVGARPGPGRAAGGGRSAEVDGRIVRVCRRAAGGRPGGRAAAPARRAGSRWGAA